MVPDFLVLAESRSSVMEHITNLSFLKVLNCTAGNNSFYTIIHFLLFVKCG